MFLDRIGNPKGSFIVPCLVVACIALGYLNWELWTRTIDVSATAGSTENSEEDAASGKAAELIAPSPPHEDLSQTTERPIFNSTRRPVVAAKGAADETQSVAASAVPPDQLTLVGVIRVGKNGGRALIRGADDLPGSWMLAGDSISGWQIRTISDDAAIIENAGQQYELRISYAKGGSESRTATLTR